MEGKGRKKGREGNPVTRTSHTAAASQSVVHYWLPGEPHQQAGPLVPFGGAFLLARFLAAAHAGLTWQLAAELIQYIHPRG